MRGCSVSVKTRHSEGGACKEITARSAWTALALWFSVLGVLSEKDVAK